MRSLFITIFLLLSPLHAQNEERFTHPSDDTVLDHQTQLLWQDSEDNTKIVKTWEDAVGYCKHLDLQGLEWRLPTQDQLLTIIDFTQVIPNIFSAFNYVVEQDYWTQDHEDTEHAQSIYFGSGCVNSDTKDKTLYVRCVHPLTNTGK